MRNREEDDRERQALDPEYFVRMMNCEPLTVAWRRECAIKAFTGLRPAEFYGLRWPDVRLDAAQPIIKVQRARNMKNGKIGPLKNRQSHRDVPVHPHLRPLLLAMRDEATDKQGLVMPISDERVREVEANPARVRESLRLIGVTETDPELIDGTESLRPFDDRSWRTTFATWCRDAGYDSDAIDAWLGHSRKTTAAKHNKKGVVHFDVTSPRPARAGVTPPLPDALLTVPSFGRFWSWAETG